MRYRAFGLTVGSDTDWLPLCPAESDKGADVEFGFGPTPAVLTDAAVRCARFDARPGVLLYRTRAIADFLIEDGCRVTIAPKDGHDRLSLINLTLGAISGALLLQRGTPTLHGCTIDTPRGAIVICGASGAGKSTLAMLLLRRGFRLLDDNVAPLAEGLGGWTVAPGTGFVRLSRESYALLAETPGGPAITSPVFVKHLHALRETEWTSVSRPLHSVWLLDRQSPELVTPLTIPQKVAMLRAHWFVGHMAQGLGQSALLFNGTLALARTVPMFLVGCPPTLTPDAWADAVAHILTAH